MVIVLFLPNVRFSFTLSRDETVFPLLYEIYVNDESFLSICRISYL